MFDHFYKCYNVNVINTLLTNGKFKSHKHAVRTQKYTYAYILSVAHKVPFP